MNPLSINPLALLGGALAAVAIGFGSGWAANGWRLGAEISAIKAERATDRADQAQAALTDLAEASKKINDAAGGAQADISSLGVKLDQIQKDFKNAKPTPLPPGCRPDAVRVRSLAAAVDATNAAIAGLRLSSTMQDAGTP